MTVIPLGRGPLSRSAVAARGPRGHGGVSPRVDFEQLEHAIRGEGDRIAKAQLFLRFLKASGISGEIEIDEIEKRFWMLLDCPTDEARWTRTWLSMSRALGKVCVKRQRRSGGGRKQVLIIPGGLQ